MTKKEFKAMVSIHVYGKGSNRRVCLFFDWNNNPDVGRIGYKYMVKGYGVTQPMILTDAYDIIIKKLYDALCWYDVKIAKTDSERFKVPIIG